MQRYAPYPEYLPDGVPVGWEKKRLRFALQINPSKGEIKLQERDEVSFVPMDAVGEYGGIRLSEERELSEVGSGYTYFCDDDVVVAKITPCFENGKGALAKGLKNKTAFGTTELHVLRVDQTQLDPHFLFYLTICSLFRKLGESEMYGAGGQKRVPESFIKDFGTGLPPVPEQQTVARFLDYKTAQIDALIVRKQALLEKLAEKRSALISHAVTKGLDPSVPMKDSGVAWLGEIPAHWRVLPLRRLVFAVKTGTTPHQVNDAHFEVDGLQWIRPGDFSGSMLLDRAENNLSVEGRAAVRVFPAGTVMHVGIGATIGKVGVTTREASCNQQVNAIVCNENLNNFFAAYFLQSIQQFIVKCGKYTTLPILNQDETKGLLFSVPPVEEQLEIVDYLSTHIESIERQKGKIDHVIAKLWEYRSALITNAVTGKIDVRGFKLPEAADETAHA